MSFAPPLVGESALDSAGLWLLSIGACLAGLRTYFDGTLETARALVIESTRLGGRIVAPIAPAAGAPRLIGQDVAARVLTVACDHVGELQRRAVVAVSRRAAPIGMMFEPRAGQASEPGPPVTSAVSAWLLLGSAAGCAWRAAAAKIKRGEDKERSGSTALPKRWPLPPTPGPGSSRQPPAPSAGELPRLCECDHLRRVGAGDCEPAGGPSTGLAGQRAGDRHRG